MRFFRAGSSSFCASRAEPSQGIHVGKEAIRAGREWRGAGHDRRAGAAAAARRLRGGYSQEVRHSYVILLCSAVWSVPAELIWEIPASTVIAFYMGHDTPTSRTT